MTRLVHSAVDAVMRGFQVGLDGKSEEHWVEQGPVETASVRREPTRAFDSSVSTGRRAVLERLSQEIARSKRSGAEFSLALIELDNSEAWKQEVGESTFDAVADLSESVMRETLRGSDVVFRIGATEFALILPDTPAPNAYATTQRLRARIAEVEHEGRTVTVSIGIAEHALGRQPEELVAKADLALHRARESGGNQSRAEGSRPEPLHPASLARGLTVRERHVLAHIVDRRTEQEIGEQLGISPGTVRSHKARIRRKLHVPPETRLADFVAAHLADLSGHIDPLDGRSRG